MPDEKQTKTIAALVFVCTVVAVIVLMIDFRIKSAILESAQKVRADIERFERKYYNGEEAVIGSNPLRSGDNLGSARLYDLDRNAGMEKATPLAEAAHGFGPPSRREDAFRGSGSNGVEVPEGDGGMGA